MKKSILIAVLAATTIFTTSCSKDDEPTPITIESTLTTSKQAYQNASDGNWVEVTKEEYGNLATTLNDVSKIATEDTDYLTDDSKISSNNPSFTLANGNGVDIPANSYVFAFRFYSKSDNHEGSKVKISSTDIKSGYSDLGGTLPTVDKGDHFFVLKGNNTKIDNKGYLAIFFNSSIGFNPNSKRIVFSRGDNNTLTSDYSNNSTFLYQGLSTTKKQW